MSFIMSFIYLGTIPYVILFHIALTKLFKRSDTIKMLYIECGILERILFMIAMLAFYFIIVAAALHFLLMCMRFVTPPAATIVV